MCCVCVLLYSRGKLFNDIKRLGGVVCCSFVSFEVGLQNHQASVVYWTPVSTILGLRSRRVALVFGAYVWCCPFLCCPYCSYSICSFGTEVNHNQEKVCQCYQEVTKKIYFISHCYCWKLFSCNCF